MFLTITLETLGIACQPRCTVGSSLDAIGTVSALAKTTGLASSRGKSTALTVLVDGVYNPVNASIVTNLGVARVDHNNFVVLHSSVLVHPVGIEHPEVGVDTSDLFFGDGLQVAFKFQMVDTLMLGLTPNHTTVVLTFASSATDSATNDNVSLLGLESKSVCLVRTGWLGDASHLGALTVLPCADTEQKPKGIRLLVAPKLLHILVSSHCE